MTEMAPNFKVGDKVFAKIRGYPAWPAQIERIDCNSFGKSKFHVFFYGTYETAVCKIDDLFHFNDSKEKYGKPMKRKGFMEALAQIEGHSPVPEINSTHKIKSEVIDTDSENILNVDGSIADDSTNTVKKKKNNLKRKRDSGTEIMEKKYSDLNKVHVVPPQKKIRKSVSDPSPNVSSISTNHQEIVSRSGRKIKPKKFADEVISQHISSSDLVESDITYNKRGNVKHKSPPTSANSNVPAFKTVIKSENVNHELEARCSRAVTRIDKLTWFRNEARLLELEDSIRSQLCMNHANTEKTIEALEQISDLTIQPLTLKKFPRVVQTIKKLRAYVGNVEAWNFNEEQKIKFSQNACDIRSKAEQVFKKIKDIWGVPECNKFSKIFQTSVEEFQKKTKSLTHEKMCALTQDPTLMPNALDDVKNDQENETPLLKEIKKEPIDDLYDEPQSQLSQEESNDEDNLDESREEIN